MVKIVKDCKYISLWPKVVAMINQQILQRPSLMIFTVVDSSMLLSCSRLQTALHKAALYGYRSICKTLVDSGASLMRKDHQVS